jgi:hypothetical protein
MATSTSLHRQEQAKPVTGSVRWLRPLVLGKTLGRIAITNANHETTEYDIGAFTDRDGIVQGFGLAKDDDEVYAIDTTAGFGWVCDCADCQFRNRECKHIKAVRAALAHAGITVPAPKRQETAKEEPTYYRPDCRRHHTSALCPTCTI